MVIDFIKNIFSKSDKNRANEHALEIDLFPSRGLFYPDNTFIKIKKPDIDIQLRYYNRLNNSSESPVIFNSMYYVVNKCIVDSNIEIGDILAVDIPYIFSQIVTLYIGAPLVINGDISLTRSNIYQFDLDKIKYSTYSRKDKCFYIGDWHYTPIKSKHQIVLNNIMTEAFINNNIDAFKKASNVYIYFLGKINELTDKVLLEVIYFFNDLSDLEIESIKKAREELIHLNYLYVKNIKTYNIYYVDFYNFAHTIWPLSI